MAMRSFIAKARPVVVQHVRVNARGYANSARRVPISSLLVGASFVAIGAGFALPSLTDDKKWTYDDVKEAIIKTIDAEEERRSDGTSIAPTLVRLAWHCAGTFSKVDGSGGSNGCRMRFNPEAGWGANAGLSTARAALDPLKQQFPGITSADLYTLAGVVAVSAMGGPEVAWRPGRVDFNDGTSSPADGRLPNADMGNDVATAQHLRDIFYRMGFNDREIVALSGAHAVGRCHEDASGYSGPWTRAETTFSNEFFRLLHDEKWTPKKSHNKCEWKGPHQLEDPSGELMMLPSDVVLTKDGEFDQWVTAYAQDQDLFFDDFSKAFSKLLELGVEFDKKSAAPQGGLLDSIKKILGL